MFDISLKRLLFPVLAAMTMWALPAAAQYAETATQIGADSAPAERPKNLVYLDPFRTLDDGIRNSTVKLVFGYERALTDHVSVALEGHYTHGSIPSAPGINVIGAGIAMPLYLSKSFEGLFLQPMVRFAYGFQPSLPEPAKVIAVGAFLGWGWLWGRVSLRPAYGIEYIRASIADQVATTTAHGLRVLLGVTF